MRAIKRPVLRYHGGKFGVRGRTADFIVSQFPPHRIYVEPFGGAASVLMRKPRSYSEIYNDKWDGVVTLFRVLRDPIKAARLEELLRLTPFARAEFEAITHEAMAGLDDVEYARQLIFRSFAGFGSGASNPHYNTGFRGNSNRSGTTPAQDWANYPDLIRHFTERLQGVVIENCAAIRVMKTHDAETTLFYVDPPYVHAARSQKRRRDREYVHELTDEQHRALASFLRSAAGLVVLSSYQSDLYNELYGDWPFIDFDALADGARPRTERLWFNNAAWSKRPKDAPKQFNLL